MDEIPSIESASEPNQTLYIKNLNDKVNKHEVKRLLYQLFSAYGYILEIYVSKAPKKRGQAFIVFDAIHDAALAKQALQNFNFLEKSLNIDYARDKSDVIARREGTYETKVKQKRAALKRAKIQETIEKVSKELDSSSSTQLNYPEPTQKSEKLT